MIMDEQPKTENNENGFSSSNLATLLGTPEQTSVELKVKSLTCPTCGSPIMDGEVMCSYCRVGLTYELVAEGKNVKFNLPPGAKLVDRSSFSSGDAEVIAKKMKDMITEAGEVLYVMMSNVPMIITAETEPNTAVENFKKLNTHLKRAELGALWTNALFKYKQFVEKIVALSPDQKEKMFNSFEKKHKEQKGFNLGQIRKFIARPEFSEAMSIAGAFPGADDSEALQAFVKKFDEYLQKVS